MSRIFTFGCSITQYAWPTWAVVMSYDLKVPVINFARPGIGNVGIFHAMIYANLRYKFTKDDKIFVLWSSWSREDRIKDKKWTNSGTVFAEVCYDQKFIKRHWDIDNDIVKNATAIISANQLFKDNIVWQGNWTEPFLPESNDDFPTPSPKMVALYKQHLPEIPCYALDGVELAFGGLVPDCHPDVRRHLNFAKEVILPSLNKTMDSTTEDRFNEIHNEIMILIKLLKKSHKNNLELFLKEIMKFMDKHPDVYEFITTENRDDILKY